MQTNDRWLIAGTILFTALFYQQAPGLNFALFAAFFVVAASALTPKGERDSQWIVLCAAVLITATAVALINSVVSVLACIAAIGLASSRRVHRASWQATALFAFISQPASIFLLAKRAMGGALPAERVYTRKKQAAGIAVAAIISVGFFFLYRVANPLFGNATSAIRLQWVDAGLAAFACAGLLIVNALLSPLTVPAARTIDTRLLADIRPAGEGSVAGGAAMPGIIMFAALNIMLLLLNGLDCLYLYGGKPMPAGITLSGFVHDAVLCTGLAIVSGAALIAVLFRGDLNFSSGGRHVKVLVYLWLLQSALVIANTAVRNARYIAEFQLTRDRVGVFVFLVLCAFPLVLTFVKLQRKWSTWRLLSHHVAAAALLLVTLSVADWDRLITRYNLSHAPSGKHADVGYLLSLSNANLPELVDASNRGQVTAPEKAAIARKLLNAYYRCRETDWRSENLRNYNVRSALMRFR